MTAGPHALGRIAVRCRTGFGAARFELVVSGFLLVALSGCGGGAVSSPPAVEPVEKSRSLPSGIPSSVYLWIDTFRPGAPVREFGSSTHVGADVAPPAGVLAARGSRNGIALTQGRVRDGVGAGEVVDYLRVAAGGNPSSNVRGLRTYGTYLDTGKHPITVEVMLTDRTRDRSTRDVAQLTEEAVAILNSALPFERQIRFSPHLTETPLTPQAAGTVSVWFVPKTHERYPPADPDELGRARVWFTPRDRNAAVLEVDESGAAWSDVLIDPEAIAALGDEEVVHVLVHELLHAVGFCFHTDPERFDSALSAAGFSPGTQPRSLIYPIDREGLQAAYMRFKPGTSLEDISADKLGPWADTSFHLRGEVDIGSGEAAFGVALRNGLAQPWAFGPTPATTLRDNPALSGSATWNGALVGFTPEAREVVGDASLVLDMSDLLGEIAFTEMRFESGGTWGDGDLHYSVRAEGPGRLGNADPTADNANRFRRAGAEFDKIGRGYVRTDSDLGTVTGIFFGPRHEGMGGVLERHDLTAAFGGRR